MVYTLGFTIHEVNREIFCGRGEMVYTLVLGTSALTGVEVQVLSPAQKKSSELVLGVDCATHSFADQVLSPLLLTQYLFCYDKYAQ